MKAVLAFTCTAGMVICSSADQAADELRKEFEAYRMQSEARIRTLENMTVSRDQDQIHQGDQPDRTTKDFEFHGYFRAGLGVNGNGDAMEAFQAPNAGSKYRLGNEAETYIEATYQQNFRTQELIENNIDIYTKLTFAYFTPTVDNNNFDTTTSLREAFAGARGVWDTKKEALFWAGNRFYQHLDIHITDFFFRDMAGFGGGIEDVALGDEMKWAAAWLGGSIDQLDSSGTAYTNDYHFNKNTLNLRLYDIPVGIGKLELIGDIADFSGDRLETAGADIIIESGFGWALGAILQTPLSDKIANRFTMQYGEGVADNFRAVITAPQGLTLAPGDTFKTEDTRRFRMTDDVVIDHGNPVSLQCMALYENYDNGVTGPMDWISLGARPVYHFNEYWSLAFEAGADYTNQDNGSEGVLGKFTLAPQIQPSADFFARPSIRAFLTYATWSDGFEGMVAPTGYSDETHGISAGVQMEAWW
ncbi:maltoporin [Pontiella agarivorans]|uniref:Carbohydrate porin n=1 Tax=Pontiella agarivorans TaxID=3038953 RepID=A0ABU5N1R0_9BACT|nr:carbohydrate porin [Pontiella agarivorans]MDZ8120348.1 carbohydrate porin [Pontiella agarivorans]